jgi:hypothetical protein
MSNLSSIAIVLASVLLFNLSACASTQIDTEIVQVHTPTLSFPISSIPPTPLPEGAELINTSTPLSPSFTPAPTLPAKEAYSLLASWLQNNNDCKLPCWGELTLGESTSLEAYTKLTALGGIVDFFNYFHPTGGWVPITYPVGDLAISIDINVISSADRGTIQAMWISTRTLREVPGGYEEVYNAPPYNELLGAYALDRLLSQYGAPAKILVRADIYTTGTQETFSITLLYPDKGVFVRYNMLAERIDDHVRGCPSYSFVELWLLSPEDSDVYQNVLLSNDLHWEGEWSYTTPIQEAASMSVEDFYQLFKETTDLCLETPLSIWPEH